MSELQPQTSKVKSKQDYSRNVKKLKVKLQQARNEIQALQKKVDSLTHTNNDKMISLKISKFCKERRFTPEMLFRFADRKGDKNVSKIDFKETLVKIGLKLTKDQTMRLEYLIDEDLSGSISWNEYNSYLDSFGIKKQFTPGQTTAKEALKKIDFDKLFQGDDDISKRDKRERPVLLNYQDFVVYCHKHFKELKDKQIANIFDKLQRNQMINIKIFLDYLKDHQEQQKKIDDKNKKKKPGLKKGQSLAEDSSAIKESNTLKGLILALFRIRKNSQPIFHSAQFMRLEKLLNRSRGELTSIFKQIDSKRKLKSSEGFRGNFGYNELINFYISYQEKGKDLLYAFELMGRKLIQCKTIPEAIISQYTAQPDKIAKVQFQKFMETQFEVTDKQYQILAKTIKIEEKGNMQVAELLQLMKVQEDNRKIYIRPNLNVNRLIFRNGLMALRCCLEIEEKLVKNKITTWDDYQFGPIEQDQFGNDSIDVLLPVENVAWKRVIDQGMNQFYQPDATKIGQITVSPSCPHTLLGQSIWSLAKALDTWMYPKNRPDSSAKQIGQKQLQHLFSGIYPYIFHPFAKYGIYVLKIWAHEEWRYVIIDDKIPCGIDEKPYFSIEEKSKFSFVSLLEKAMAKMYGTYRAAFEIRSTQRYLMEFTGALCLEEQLAQSMLDEAKDSIWSEIVNAFAVEQVNQNKAKKHRIKDVMFGMFKSPKEGIDTDYPLDLPLKVQHVLQLSNPNKTNKHKSHRILFFNPGLKLKNEQEWNKGWSKAVPNNKYQTAKQLISKVNKNLTLNQNIMTMNYKLFRKGFNLIKMRQVDWFVNIILRKQLEFQEKYKCRYEITAKSNDLELVIYLRQQTRIENPKVFMDITTTDKEEKEIVTQKIFKSGLSIYPLKFQKNKTVILEFYVENWKKEEQYLYGLTFYFSHPRFDLKQRDRHMLFRYVSPYEEEAKIQWSDFTKAQKLFIYHHFHKAAEPHGCCSCL